MGVAIGVSRDLLWRESSQSVDALRGAEGTEYKRTQKLCVILRRAPFRIGPPLIHASNRVHRRPGGGQKILIRDLSCLRRIGEHRLKIQHGLLLPGDAAFSVLLLAVDAQNDSVQLLLVSPEGDANRNKRGKLAGEIRFFPHTLLGQSSQLSYRLLYGRLIDRIF